MGEMLRARPGDGSSAPSRVGLTLDGSPVPLGSTAAHDPVGVAGSLWARWKSPPQTQSGAVSIKVRRWGQTVSAV